MRRRGVSGWFASVLAVAAIVATSAFAAQPTMERIDIDETSADEFLTEECGVPVTTTAQGHVIVRTFS